VKLNIIRVEYYLYLVLNIVIINFYRDIT